MKNKRSIAARASAALAASIFAFTWVSASAADLAGTANPLAGFQAVAESNLLVLGPVELVDPSKARVQVLGQWIPLSQNQASQSLEGLVGHVLAVYGSIASDGSLKVATVHEQHSIQYV